MKLALLGDIHANYPALCAVLSAARRIGVEKFLLTGDIVGYYFWPAEVMDLLTSCDMLVVRGNHEAMLTESRKNAEYLQQVDKRYGTGLRVALETLSSEQLDWLGNLPHPQEIELDGCSILLCHGSPWDLDQYIYPDADQALLERCCAKPHDWVILGHTHYPMEHRLAGSTIVNPGSVGQPRNYKPGAHWALLDTSTQELTFMVEEYDYSPVAQAARARQPDIPYLHEVFARR